MHHFYWMKLKRIKYSPPVTGLSKKHRNWCSKWASWITNYELRVTNYELQLRNCQTASLPNCLTASLPHRYTNPELLQYWNCMKENRRQMQLLMYSIFLQSFCTWPVNSISFLWEHSGKWMFLFLTGSVLFCIYQLIWTDW